MDTASPNAGNGGTPSHRPDGSFAPGNKLGKGNPNGKHWARLRQRVIELGKECPEGIGEHSRERLLALGLWNDALLAAHSVRDRLHATELIVAIYGGKKALQGDGDEENEQSIDPDALATQAVEHLQALGLGNLIPPGLRRGT